MGILEIITAVASLLALAGGIGIAIWVNDKLKETKTTAEGPQFSGPRSKYGDAIPYVFGTVQVTSPVVIYGGAVYQGKPFLHWPTRGTVPDAEYDALVLSPREQMPNQYQVSLDMVLSERIFKNGSPLGTVVLQRIWYGQNLLWDGSGFSVKVTGSGTLLDWDPRLTSGPSLLPGGLSDVYTVGSGWWQGGIVKRRDGYDDGDIMGWWRAVWDAGLSKYTTGFGLEAVRFYVGNGAEVRNDWICNEITSDPSYWPNLYPTYSKFVRLVFEDFVFGPEVSLSDISVEISVRIPAPEIGDVTGIMQNNYDINPVSLLYQLLTNPEFLSGTKMPPINVASFSAARATVYTEQLGMSYRLQSPTKASELIETILTHIDGMLYREPTTGEMVLALNRAPNIALIPTFSEAIVKADGLTNFTKSTYEATYGQTRMMHELRSSAPNKMYAQNVAVAKDLAVMQMSGIVESLDDQTATAFDGYVANKLAARKLAIANTPLIAFELACTRELEGGASVMNLRPGDCFYFSYSPLGIKKMVARVLRVDLGTHDDRTVKLSVIQDRYVPPPVIAPPQVTDAPTKPAKPNASITISRVITAPYPIARAGLGDARRALTTATVQGNGISSVYPTPGGMNFDRFLVLAKRPYQGASALTAQLQDQGTPPQIVETLLGVPYTPCGQLGTAIASTDGGTNQSYDNTVLTPFDITGLYPDDIKALFSGLRIDGKNILLIDDEWILVIGFTVLSSTSVRVTSYSRMIWDSPIVLVNVPSMRPAHSLGALVWILDASPTAEAKLSQKLFSPLPSCFATVVRAELISSTSDPLAEAANTMPVQYYNVKLTNADQARNNLVTTQSSIALLNRANKMLPRRRIYVSWVAGTANGFGYNLAAATAQTAQTNFDFRFPAIDAPSALQFNCLQPREGTRAHLFDGNIDTDNISEENSPPISGWTQLVVGSLGVENYVVSYQVNGGTIANTQRLGSGVYRCTIPSTGAFTLDLYIYRVPRAGSDTCAPTMRSTPRSIRLAVTRV